LISEIKANAGELLSVRDHPAERAASALAEIGAPAVRPVLDAMGEHFPRNQDPREVIEALGRILGAIAVRDPAPLLEVLARDEVPPDPEMLFARPVRIRPRGDRDDRDRAFRSPSPPSLAVPAFAFPRRCVASDLKK
jgi:hypothetical protein